MTSRTEKIAVIPIPSFLIPNVPVGSAECRPEGLEVPRHSLPKILSDLLINRRNVCLKPLALLRPGPDRLALVESGVCGSDLVSNPVSAARYSARCRAVILGSIILRPWPWK